MGVSGLAISATGDLVLDVVRAADPAAAEAARAKLASFAAKTKGIDFAAAAGAMATSPETAKETTRATPEAFVRFEAMVLQSFIQNMLPSDADSVYGGGVAGQMWQSLMAEKLGETIATRGGIGIADRILRDHYAAGEETVPLQGVSADPDAPARAEQRLLSTALIHEIQRRAAHALGTPQPLSDTEHNQPKV